MRQIDCYTELLTYAGYFLTDLQLKGIVFSQVSARFEELISRSRECGQKNGIPADIWQAGFFPVCALIDELILQSEWPDKSLWLQALLQRKYFNTTNAGEDFFNRLDRLKKEDRDIREVYDYCLAIGFKGRYFGGDDERKLTDIQYSNLKQVIDDPDLSFPATIFPEAYEPATRKKRKRKWSKFSGISILLIIISILLCFGLYVVLDRVLTTMVSSYFGPDFIQG